MFTNQTIIPLEINKLKGEVEIRFQITTERCGILYWSRIKKLYFHFYYKIYILTQ